MSRSKSVRLKPGEISTILKQLHAPEHQTLITKLVIAGNTSARKIDESERRRLNHVQG